MATFRDIRTNQADVSCDICGRTLLRGEEAVPFLAGGARRQVCELCTARATHEGWIREAGGDELGVSSARQDARRSLIGRLRGRHRATPTPVPEAHEELDPALAAELAAGEHPVIPADAPPPEPPRRRRLTMRDRDRERDKEREREKDREPEASTETRGDYELPREPRNVRAVPTNAELKMVRALEVFNGSEHVRTVGGIARSLGPPAIAVRPLADRPSVVGIAVMWELSWYRFEVDLSDEAGGVLRAGHGAELAELEPEERSGVNAAADPRGALSLA